MNERAGIIARFRTLLDLPEEVPELSLGEGDTPLIPVPKIAEELGGGFELFIKYEGLNPTGSFKDRGMVVAIAEAKSRGATTVLCASTGNTAASAAAYASRAGIRAIVLVPEGNVARGKIAGAAVYGAQIVEIRGSFDDALRLAREAAEKLGLALVNSINPFRIAGQKTAAFEIVDAIGTPDWLCLPVGNAGNITAYARGFLEYGEKKLPHLLGVQAAGAAPLVIGKTVEHPETIATAIRIGNPARGKEAKELVEQSGGKFASVTDEQILTTRDRLAKEGIWVEPASAAGLAGLMQEIEKGTIDAKGKKIVIVATGHGLKDPDSVIVPETKRIEPTLADLSALLA